MPGFDTEYQELFGFIQNIETKINDNFQDFNETLANRYKEWSYQIEQIKAKKLFYLKNLDKFEQNFKQQNSFSSVKEELEFFHSYSNIMDDKIEEVEEEISQEKAKIKKNKELIKKYRSLIKSKIRQNAYFKYSVTDNKAANKDAKENVKTKESYSNGFFITENNAPAEDYSKKRKMDVLQVNLNTNYNLFIECINLYFNSYINKSKVSKNSQQHTYDFEVINNLYHSSHCNKKIACKNIVDIVKSKVGSEHDSITIKSPSKLYAAIKKILGNTSNSNSDLLNKEEFKVEDIPWQVFSQFSAKEVFLVLLYKVHMINVIIFEWQDCIRMDSKMLQNVNKQITV